MSSVHITGWEWQGSWTVDTKGNVDGEGWQYGSNFGLMRYPPGKGADNRGPLDVVRRRRWVRVRNQAKGQLEADEGPSSSDQPTPISDVSEGALQASQSSTERQVLGRISPGDTLALPMGWNSTGNDDCILLPGGLPLNGLQNLMNILIMQFPALTLQVQSP